jgi:phosphomevalonate kinase
MPSGFQSYDSSSGGPSQEATVATMASQDAITSQQNISDYKRQDRQLNHQFLGTDDQGNKTGFGSANALASSLGAQGNLYSGAGQWAEGQAQSQFANQHADLTSAFHRAQNEWKRNEAFAAIGLVL